MPVSSNIFSLNSITPSTSNLIGDLRVTFEHSYFNILLNNIYGARKSSHYFDVDYNNTSQFLPVNFNYIISKSAAVAPIQDSNYTAKRVISSRYEGSKTVSDDYQLEGTSSYGPQYTIDWTTPYFAVFEEVTDAFPKGGGGSKLTISKLVYKDGTTIPLDDRGNNYFDVTTIFKPNDGVSIYYTNIPSGTFIADNLANKTVDESGHLYATIASYKPSTILPSGIDPLGNPNPYVNQDDNVAYYSFLDISSSYDIYREQVSYGFNNLIAQKSGENAFYMYFNIPNSASSGFDPFNSTGYFLGMGLILRNFYPSTGEQYPSYRKYPWVRFEHFNTSSATGLGYPPYVNNYNFYINTELLPVKEGDYIRLYNATEAPVDAYSNDSDLFFLSNASGSFIKDSIYDSIIDEIDYTLPTSLNFLTISGSANLVSENFLISNTSASIYRTSNRFGDISPAVRNDPPDVFVCSVQDNGTEIGPKKISPSTKGDNTIFKKLYTVQNLITSSIPGNSPSFFPPTQYKYWAIGNSGSLYRSETLGGTLPFTFTPVTSNDVDVFPVTGLPFIPLNIIESCSINSMFFLNDSPLYYNPNLITMTNPPIRKSYFQYGLFAAVGDSGSIFISRNFGNTWSDISLDSNTFPNKDKIHFKDVFIHPLQNGVGVGNSSTHYIIAVGTSGSIYMTYGDIFGNAASSGIIANPNKYPFDFKNRWRSYCSYQNFVDFAYYSSTFNYYNFPGGFKRENITFNRILPVQHLMDDSNVQQSTGFVLLTNSGSIFFLPGYVGSSIAFSNIYEDNTRLYDGTGTPGVLDFATDPSTGDSFGKLIAITGSYINSLIYGGASIPITANLKALITLVDSEVPSSYAPYPLNISED